MSLLVRLASLLHYLFSSSESVLVADRTNPLVGVSVRLGWDRLDLMIYQMANQLYR